MMEPSRPSSWLAPAVVGLLTLQLALTWIQGSLLHRQHADLMALRDDIQTLADSMEQGSWQGDEGDSGLAPARRRARHARPRLCRVRQEQAPAQAPPPEEKEPAMKDIEATKASAQKAISDARDIQSKVSWEENARKAEEKAKMDAASNAWLKWVWAALGAGLLAMVVRGWLRRRN